MAIHGLDEADWRDLEHEVLELFTALLRVDTSHGGETACAELLRDYLAANGIPSTLLGELPERQNLIAGLNGDRPGPTLTLMGHLDVVPADAAEWSVPPFAGVVADGYVWGCGATDMKNQVAAEAVALARLKRRGAGFAGAVKFAATADEEVGDVCGVRWLCREHPDALRADYLLNEGAGGLWLDVDGRQVFLLGVGEKAFAQFRIRTRGRGGHASVPEKQHSAVIDLARAVTALGLADPPAQVSALTASLHRRAGHGRRAGRAPQAARHGARRRRRAARRRRGRGLAHRAAVRRHLHAHRAAVPARPSTSSPRTPRRWSIAASCRA